MFTIRYIDKKTQETKAVDVPGINDWTAEKNFRVNPSYGWEPVILSVTPRELTFEERARGAGL